jgi:TP901 family phage tail tape measure protein
MAASFQLPAVFTAIDRYTAPVKKMQAATRSFATSAEANLARVERRFTQLNKSMKGVNNFMSTGLGVGGGLLLFQAIRTGADAMLSLDKNISAAAAKMGIFERGSKEFQDIRNAALDAGATTMFTASQAAEGLDFLALAGFKGQHAIMNLNGVLALATATQTELGRATDIATDSLGAFGLASKDPVQNAKNLASVTDVLAKTTTSFNTNMDDLFETVKDAGAVFIEAGGSMQEFGAIAGIMANAGIKGTRAGTAIKNMMLNLQAPTAAITKTLSDMGVTIDDGTGKMKPFSQIILEMSEATKNYTPIARNAAFATIFGKRAITGASLVFKAGAAEVDKYTKMLNDEALGTTRKMADFMGGGLHGAVMAANSAFESVTIALGDGFQPEIDKTIKLLTDVAIGARGWIKENKELLKLIAKGVVLVVKLFIAIKILGLVIGVLRTIMIAWNIVTGISLALQGKMAFAIRGNTIAMKAYAFTSKAMTFATKIMTAAQAALAVTMWGIPIVWIIAGIIALIAIIVMVVKKYDEWGAAITILLGPLGMVINLIMAFRRNWSMVVQAFKTEGIVGGLKAIGKVIIDSLLMPVQQLLELASKIPGLGFAGDLAEKIKDIRSNLGVSVSQPAANQNAAAVAPSELFPSDPSTGLLTPGGTAPVAEPINRQAEVTKTLTERSEVNQNQRVTFDVVDPGGLIAGVTQEGSAPIDVNLKSTVGI